MTALVRDALLVIYFIPGEGEEAIPLEGEGAFFVIYTNLFSDQKLKLLQSIERGFRDISFSVIRVGETYFIEKIWNSISEEWENWSNDWPQGEELEKFRVSKETTQYNSTLNQLFNAGVEEVELFFKKLAKKRAEKYEI